MTSLRFRRFTQPLLLRGVERGLLDEFLGKFQNELTVKGVALPDRALPDDEYFHGLSKLMMSPEGLPDSLNEALYAVDDMATGAGCERLYRAVSAPALEVREDSSDLDYAIQAWLQAPALFSVKHAELRSSRIPAAAGLSPVSDYQLRVENRAQTSAVLASETTVDCFTGLPILAVSPGVSSGLGASAVTAQSVLEILENSDDGVDVVTFDIPDFPFAGHGILTGFDPATGQVTYMPEADFKGTDWIVFSANDGEATSVPGGVELSMLGSWQVTIHATNAVEPSVTFSFDPDATDAYDPLLDVMDAFPGTAQPEFFHFVAGGNGESLRCDVRGLPFGLRWLLEFGAGAADIELSWGGEGNMIPEHGLRLWLQVLGGDKTPGTTIDMTATQSFTVPAGTRASLVISGPLEFVLPLHVGWNTVSLPLDVPDPAPRSIFVTAPWSAGRELGTVAIEGPILGLWSGRLGAQVYEPVTSISALAGCWAYAPTSAQVVVRGLPPTVDVLQLEEGWQLVGPPGLASIPPNPDIAVAWRWTGTHYTTAHEFIPGQAVLLYLRRPTILSFGGVLDQATGGEPAGGEK